MASVRLTKSLKEEIIKGLLAHKYLKSVEALCEKQKDFAHKVYNDVYSKAQREQMNKLPNGWLPTKLYVRVQFGASCNYAQLTFAGDKGLYDFRKYFYVKAPKNIELVIPYRDINSCSKRYENTDKLAEEYQTLKDEHDDLLNKVHEDERKAAGTIGSITTLKALLKAWPEIKPFVPDYALRAQKDNLPALPVKQLNKTFDLPVEEVA